MSIVHMQTYTYTKKHNLNDHCNRVLDTIKRNKKNHPTPDCRRSDGCNTPFSLLVKSNENVLQFSICDPVEAHFCTF